MPAKSKKSTKIIDKSVSKVSKSSEDIPSWKLVDKNVWDSEKSKKKVVIKRRKVDLVPTRASAVAIASQANRAKKQALIEKFASWENIELKKKSITSTRIPVRVWIFFWCSLLLFCISFYQAIIRPQFENVQNVNLEARVKPVDWENSVSLNAGVDVNSWSTDHVDSVNNVWNSVSKTAEWVIQEFFWHLSDKEFDLAFNMFTPALQRSPEILEHFTSFRMDPFISWIEWGNVVPSNIHFVTKTDSWKDKYSLNVSYVLSSNQQKYDEEWEFVLDDSWDEPRIVSVLCVTSKCSYHPIFRPENFGLMK